MVNCDEKMEFGTYPLKILFFARETASEQGLLSLMHKIMVCGQHECCSSSQAFMQIAGLGQASLDQSMLLIPQSGALWEGKGDNFDKMCPPFPSHNASIQSHNAPSWEIYDIGQTADTLQALLQALYSLTAGVLMYFVCLFVYFVTH